MQQIITGPFGRLAYHAACASEAGQYPVLNAPCRDFAAGRALVPVNSPFAPHVVPLPGHMHRQATLTKVETSLATANTSFKREN